MRIRSGHVSVGSDTRCVMHKSFLEASPRQVPCDTVGRVLCSATSAHEKCRGHIKIPSLVHTLSLPDPLVHVALIKERCGYRACPCLMLSHSSLNISRPILAGYNNQNDGQDKVPSIRTCPSAYLSNVCWRITAATIPSAPITNVAMPSAMKPKGWSTMASTCGSLKHNTRYEIRRSEMMSTSRALKVKYLIIGACI